MGAYVTSTLRATVTPPETGDKFLGAGAVPPRDAGSHRTSTKTEANSLPIFHWCAATFARRATVAAPV